MNPKAAAIMFFILTCCIPVAYANDCDYKVGILLNNSEFKSSDFSWKMKAIKISGDSTNITAAAKIEDSAGKIIKSYKPWNSEAISRQKTSSSYSPNLKEGRYKIVSEINVDCNDIDNSNNIDSKQFIIKNSGAQDQQKTENNVFIQNSSTESPVLNNLSENIFNNNNLTPIAKNDSNEIILSQNANNSQKEIPLFDNEIQNKYITANAAKSELAYESSNEKSKEIVLFALLGFSVILNVILIWKR